MVKISSFLKESLIDYPEKIASVVFISGCNYKCPACHAKEIIYGNGEIPEKEIFSYLGSRKGWIDGVVLCGGEPTLQQDLPEFARKLKETGISVKLDTNGSNPKILERLLKEKLVDYVALDIKGPAYLYKQLTGNNSIVYCMDRSMSLVSQFPDYEFRTTVVPVIRNSEKNEISFLTAEEMRDMARWVVEFTEKNQHKHYLQKFYPIKDELLDSRLESFPETPDKLMQEVHEKMIKYLPNCKIR